MPRPWRGWPQADPRGDGEPDAASGQGGGHAGFCAGRDRAPVIGGQTNGAGATVSELGSLGNIMNFQAADVATPGTYSSNVITASDTVNQGNSYELWFRGHWTGSFTSISNLKFWMSTNFSPSTGLTVKYASDDAYATPVATDTNITTGLTSTATIPTSTPGGNNIGIANNLSGSLSSAGYSDYIILQLHVGTTAAAGDTSLATFTLQYDET